MLEPHHWGLERRDGRLHMDGYDLTALARQYGTPLHVTSARRLRTRCLEFRRAFSAYPGGVGIHFSYKTNTVAGILRVIHQAGLGAEVVDGYELWLAQKLAVSGDQILFNGPNKSGPELTAIAHANIALCVIDSLNEIERLARIADELDVVINIGLRICPDVVPRRMNATALTGSRKTHFGLDPQSGEVKRAIAMALKTRRLNLRGFHVHLGSGIHDMKSFQKATEKILDYHLEALRAGAKCDLIDLGGGLGTRLSREFTTLELLRYLATGRLPKEPKPQPADLLSRYGTALTEAIVEGCQKRQIDLPNLCIEPGRAVVSDAQSLLLSVGALRHRPGVGRFAITDGGAMTVSMMFLSEYHTTFLANRKAPRAGKTSVVGRLPSPMDIVYRNLPLPDLLVGDILAVMDAGAYFTSTATNFGGPRPAVLLIDDEGPRLVRRRETFEDLARVELALEGKAP